MAAKVKIRTGFVCDQCGADYAQWSGQCLQCMAWNSIKRVSLGRDNSPAESRLAGYAGAVSEVQCLDQVEASEIQRLPSGMQELDRTLGGGLVPGSVVLICGDPGSGKSTILLQALAHVASQRAVLYVSGEESLQQIAGRARRLGLQLKNLKVLAETCIDRIFPILAAEKPHILVIDSIQVMYQEATDSAPGGVVQVRECAALLTRYAKQHSIVLLMIGHVTKDQSIAGPMTLSHIVDTQIMLSSTDDSRFRILRATKNRFGAVNELGLFAMTDNGLKEVRNPSAMFLNRSRNPAPGSVVNVLWEGTRPLLVEIQALVVESHHGNPRRLGVGVDQNRIAMLLAVLTRHGGLVTADQDVFVNCVGGIRVSETSADLAILLGVVSSLRNRSIDNNVFAFGEIGLSGEVRPVANGEVRIKEALKHGFKKAIVPLANVPKIVDPDVEIIGVEDLNAAIDQI